MMNAIKRLFLEVVTLSFFLLLSGNSYAGDLPTSPTRLSETEISQRLQNLPGWSVEARQLRRTYQFSNFVEAVDFVTRLVEPAETARHHPDIAIAYNKVTIILTTHDAGGLTALDFDLAQKIARLAASTQPQ